ncbi:hypothetical protein Adt_05691 [Abeliophyllum distichum]|uniref:Uncharacterized protein n=1 Tax=Abeliophyllum distichum TaxID=126358 RepID=A0ABD1V6W1_9LAMI
MTWQGEIGCQQLPLKTCFDINQRRFLVRLFSSELIVRVVEIFRSRSHYGLLDQTWGLERLVPASFSLLQFLFDLYFGLPNSMSSEVGSDSGGEVISWGRDQEEEEATSVREFNSLYTFKSDGKRSGWWYASVKVKTGNSVITHTPDSIKNWKKFRFFVRGPWQFTVNDARPDVNIPVHYHELRYVSQEPTEESSERARRARDINENLRSSSALITKENLISARLLLFLSDRPIARQSREKMNDISTLLRKKTQTQAGKGKRKVPVGDQDRSARPRVEPELPPQPAHSPVRNEEFVRLRGTLPKSVHNFIRSNSSTREEIAGLPLSIRRAIRTVTKCWTTAQQKYLESMGVVDSVKGASFNVFRAAIQLMSASEKMDRLLADVQVMRDKGRKVLDELEDEKRLQATSEDVLMRRKEELRGKDAELRALTDELEMAKKRKAEVEEEL